MKTEFDKELINNEVDIIVEKYPKYYPVYIHTNSNLKFTKNKFLIPKDALFGTLQYSIRKCIEKLKKEEALFYFINNTLINNSKTMSEVFNEFSNGEKYLIINVEKENTFGKLILQ